MQHRIRRTMACSKLFSFASGVHCRFELKVAGVFDTEIAGVLPMEPAGSLPEGIVRHPVPGFEVRAAVVQDEPEQHQEQIGPEQHRLEAGTAGRTAVNSSALILSNSCCSPLLSVITYTITNTHGAGVDCQESAGPAIRDSRI